LKIYYPQHKTELHIDAYIDEAVLIQRLLDDNLLHSVYHMSRKTKKRKRIIPVYELEMLAIIKVLKKFRVYLKSTIGNTI